MRSLARTKRVLCRGMAASHLSTGHLACAEFRESAGWRNGSRPWRQRGRRRRPEGRHRGRRWCGPGARRWRDGRRGGRRKLAVRARAASVRLAALVAIRAGRRTDKNSSAAVADGAAVGSAAQWRAGDSETARTKHTQVVDAGEIHRADGTAIRGSAAAVVDGATVGIAVSRFALDRRTVTRRAPADAVYASPAGRRALHPAIQRAAAAVANLAAVVADLGRGQTDVCARKLAGQLGAHVRGTDADVVVTNPASLRACGRAMKCAAAPVSDVAAIVKEAIRTGP